MTVPGGVAALLRAPLPAPNPGTASPPLHKLNRPGGPGAASGAQDQEAPGPPSSVTNRRCQSLQGIHRPAKAQMEDWLVCKLYSLPFKKK